MNLKTFLITALGGCITISAGAQSPGSNKSVNSDRDFSDTICYNRGPFPFLK